MKILLVKLSNASLYKSKNLTLLEPLGLEYIAAAIDKKHDVQMIDMDYQYLDEVIQFVIQYKPDFVGTTVSTPMILEARQLIDAVKKIDPKIKTIIGGGHPSALPEMALKDTHADICIVGEGELIINDILAIPENGTYRGQQVDVNSINPATRNLLKRENYQISYSFDDNELQRCASVITSRGCPFPCNYCASKTILGQNVRFRSVDSIVDEIQNLIEIHGVQAILFLDDCFTLRTDRVIALCNEIIRRNLKFYWWLDTRVDCVSKEVLEIMYKAGCRFIVYGVESGSQEVLDRIGKKITIEQIIEAFKITQEVGMNTKANFMFGHLDETKENIMDSIKLAKQIKATRYGFYLVLPIPGSKLYEIAKSRNAITKDFDKFKWYDEPVSDISKVSSDDLLELQALAYKECDFKK